MTPQKKKQITNVCTYAGGGIVCLAVAFGVPAKSLAEAMLTGAKAGVLGAFIGFLVAKLVFAFVKTTPEGESPSPD